MASYTNPNTLEEITTDFQENAERNLSYTTNDEKNEDAQVGDTDSIEKTQNVWQKGK